MLKVLYGGSPACSAKTLELLLKDSAESLSSGGADGYRVVGVLTNPPAPKGRHSELVPTDVEKYARIWNEARGDSIAVFTPEHIRTEAREEIQKAGADIFVCFAYGHILGPKALALFRFGGINLHPSLLPRYRGASPVPAAILNGDKETGISVQKMAIGMDEGDILLQKRLRLLGNETAEQVLNECAVLFGDSTAGILRQIAATGSLPPAVPQSGEASYCTAISKDDGRINWADSALHIDAQIRAYTPWPSCYSVSGGMRIKILKAAALSSAAKGRCAGNAVPGTVLEYDRRRGILVQTGDGILAVTELQWQAKKAMDYKSFMNGTRYFIGTVLE